jgi:hypothetical protein
MCVCVCVCLCSERANWYQFSARSSLSLPTEPHAMPCRQFTVQYVRVCVQSARTDASSLQGAVSLFLLNSTPCHVDSSQFSTCVCVQSARTDASSLQGAVSLFLLNSRPCHLTVHGSDRARVHVFSERALIPTLHKEQSICSIWTPRNAT